MSIPIWNLVPRPFAWKHSKSRSQWALGCIILSVVLLSVFAGNRIFISTNSEEQEFLTRFRGGTLLIAGGGDMPRIVNQRFWELAGERNSRLVIIPAYAASREDSKRLKDEWRGWQFASMDVLQASSREVADELCFSEPIQKASAVWFSGGEQSWLANLYADTETETSLQALLDRGGIIGGTSAGAAIMTKVMIQEGKRVPKLCRGLDLLKDSVVDQHFFRRNRMQRLAKTLKMEPNLIGFGIDEGTALVVHIPSGRIGVLGQSYVMACIPESETNSLRLEVLKPGIVIDMNGLRGIADGAEDEVEPT